MTPSHFFSGYFCSPLENHFLGQSSLLVREEQCSGDILLWLFILSPSPRSLERIRGLPRKFQVSFIKHLAGIFFSLAHCSFNITLDILSFMDGNRSRMGGLKIACTEREAANGLRNSSHPLPLLGGDGSECSARCPRTSGPGWPAPAPRAAQHSGGTC